MAVTREVVLKIAELASLHFNEEEIDAFARQFQRILDYMEKLSEVDTTGIEPTSHVSLSEDFERHIFREDETRESIPVGKVLANAPDAGSGHFKVPKVL